MASTSDNWRYDVATERQPDQAACGLNAPRGTLWTIHSIVVRQDRVLKPVDCPYAPKHNRPGSARGRHEPKARFALCSASAHLKS